MKLLLANHSPKHLTGCREHTHNCWEIVIPMEGQGCVDCERELFPFCRGCAYVVPPKAKHLSQSHNEFSDIFLHVDILHFPTDRLTFVSGIPEFPELAQLICRLYQSADPTCSDAINSLLTLIVELIRNLSAASEKAPLSLRVRNYLLQHIADSSTDMSVLSQVFNFSADHIRRVYRKDYGCSPMTFLAEIRLAQAKKLLINMPVYSVNEVCRLYGFSDPFYFSRFFRQRTGCSPTQFRRQTLT